MIIPGLRVQRIDGGLIERVLAEKYRAEKPREGLHCSTIVDDMMRSQWPGKYDSGKFTERERLLFFEGGNSFEALMARQLKRRIIGWEKPEPRQHRGIWFSPDGWVERSKTIDEIKFTWTSLHNFLDSTKLLGYLFQGLCYAHVWGAVRLRYHIFFVNGDYRAGKKPTCVTLICRWDDQDVPREQFRNIRQHAIDRGWLERRAA